VEKKVETQEPGREWIWGKRRKKESLLVLQAGKEKLVMGGKRTFNRGRSQNPWKSKEKKW